MDVIDNIKGVPITLNMFTNISVIQDVNLVDLPPLFVIYLFR